MYAYPATMARAPRTLTRSEQQRLLETTATHPDAFRDHIIYALALGTGLREHEIAALNVGDVYHDDGDVKRWLVLRVYKRTGGRSAPQEVILSDSLRVKLATYRTWKCRLRESIEPASPLFVSLQGNRLSKRQLRHGFAVWQRRSGFERRYTFHSLRHSACNNIYRHSRDIRLTQKFARHKSLMTTMVYTHPTDDDLVEAVQQLTC